jgi:hypothetical protein
VSGESAHLHTPRALVMISIFYRTCGGGAYVCNHICEFPAARTPSPLDNANLGVSSPKAGGRHSSTFFFRHAKFRFVACCCWRFISTKLKQTNKQKRSRRTKEGTMSLVGDPPLLSLADMASVFWYAATHLFPQPWARPFFSCALCTSVSLSPWFFFFFCVRCATHLVDVLYAFVCAFL